ncbi:MAG: hypothetical protein JOZ69_10180, partial [Myxococcales bacterium]|nr:hypothetical protein [Myxococcales bacterium]
PGDGGLRGDSAGGRDAAAPADGPGPTGDGAARDGAAPADAGATDAARPDGAVLDAAMPDAPAPDAAMFDGGIPDAATDDGATEACSAVRHSNGVGQSWQDCAPLATYDQMEATSACNAFASGCAVGTTCSVNEVSTAVPDGMGGTTVYLWVYGTGFGSSGLRAGDVAVAPRGTPCAFLSPPTARWQ